MKQGQPNASDFLVSRSQRIKDAPRTLHVSDGVAINVRQAPRIEKGKRGHGDNNNNSRRGAVGLETQG